MTYSIKFEMSEHIWSGAVLIFDDGSTKLHRHRLHPDSPVLVQVERLTPSPEQIEMCRHLWARLYEEMDFRVASFCPRLLPFSPQIMTPIFENIPA
ncbi:hypothetical protein PMN64_27015 [Bradyrhizobium sp. UFLA01-814]|uniref:hypothetical protein n=1 Tax=Bradyrhizobium sp. UFLA01-814 TaxID=3023480 RepID=UPI00398B12A4